MDANYEDLVDSDSEDHNQQAHTRNENYSDTEHSNDVLHNGDVSQFGDRNDISVSAEKTCDDLVCSSKDNSSSDPLEISVESTSSTGLLDQIGLIPQPAANRSSCLSAMLRSSPSAASAEPANNTSEITICIAPTTGGQFDLNILRHDTIHSLKKMISKKLKVPKEKICLLYRDRHLRGGSIEENEIYSGSKVILLPSIETGLLAQRPEQSVMQALESLSDSQVNDFLSGRAPLNLTMRLGDHVMLIQLQLSTVASGSKGTTSTSTSFSHTASSSFSSSSEPSTSGISSASSESFSSTSVPSNSYVTAQPILSPELFSTPSTSFVTPPDTSFSSEAPMPCSSSPMEGVVTGSEQTVPDVLNSSPISSGYSTNTSFVNDYPSTSATAATVTDTTADQKPVLDTKALAEASRNLTQTLKQLSSEVLTSKSDETQEEAEVKTTPANTSSGSGGGGKRWCRGAIIESMHHHGKGVYSGTFSGTLNPALQDNRGRPKRDISTIIHILNDLLCATPNYHAKQSETKATVEQPTSSQTNEQLPACFDQQLTDSMELEENRMTRDKVEQLKLIMEQKKLRRKERRESRSPYHSTIHSALLQQQKQQHLVKQSEETMEASVQQWSNEEQAQGSGHEENSSEISELNSEPVVA